MISVIIPVYNTEEYIDQCVSSILNQTFRDLEILLIDDASSDNSVEKLLAWEGKDPRIVVICKEKHSGVSSSRNLGLKKAHGDYICFVDSDDWIDPNFYEELHRCILQSGADMALGGYNRITGRHITSRAPDKSTGSVLSVSEALSVCMPRNNDRRADLYIWDKLFKKSALIKNGELILFDNYSICEDVLWFIQVLRNCKTVVCWSGCGYYYRFLRPGNTMLAMSSHNDLKKCQDAVEANRKVLQLVSDMEPDIKCYALQRVLFYRRHAFRTAANLNDRAAYREYRTGYFPDLIHCYSQNPTWIGFKWLIRQFLAEMLFQLSRLRFMITGRAS